MFQMLRVYYHSNLLKQPYKVEEYYYPYISTKTEVIVGCQQGTIPGSVKGTQRDINERRT